MGGLRCSWLAEHGTLMKMMTRRLQDDLQNAVLLRVRLARKSRHDIRPKVTFRVWIVWGSHE